MPLLIPYVQKIYTCLPFSDLHGTEHNNAILQKTSKTDYNDANHIYLNILSYRLKLTTKLGSVSFYAIIEYLVSVLFHQLGRMITNSPFCFTIEINF